MIAPPPPDAARGGEALLPAADEAPRCAAHARTIGLDPGGTALWVDELFVVDVAPPWPKPVWAAEGFTAVPEWVVAAGEAGRRVRVLAAMPLADGIGRVVAHRRVAGAGSLVRTEHHVAPERVADLLAVLLIDGPAGTEGTVVDASVPRRELLLCTQGSHDVCCGSQGAALALALERSHPDLALRRVSHTGGHRMAPTGITLPDARMWGMVDHAEMVRILERSGSPASLAGRCRGWTGAPDGPAQVAERAVFAAVDDWAFDEVARTVTLAEPAPARSTVVVTVDTPGGVWTVDVAPGRAVPTIACGEPGGLPAKPGTEWTVVSVAGPDFGRTGRPR